MKIRFRAQASFMPLPDFLQWLEQNERTGILTISGIEAPRSFYYESGSIIFVSSERDGQRFGEFLNFLDLASESDVRKALIESRKEKTCFTRHIVNTGLLNLESLEDALQRLAENILMDVLWNDCGVFAFTQPLPRAVVDGPVRLHSGRIIMKTIEKLDRADSSKP